MLYFTSQRLKFVRGGLVSEQPESSMGPMARVSLLTLVVRIAPCVAFGLICAALILHLRPDVSRSRP
jgi:hypothetical protein